jgi:RNA polymerase sigma factor for flagellar operon FliA
MQSARKHYESSSKLDADQQEKLILEQMSEVRFIARRIHDRLPKHVSLEDLVHSGVIGLIDAVHKFDPQKNVQFKSYAKFRIRGAILDSLRELDWSPRDVRKKARRLEETHLALRNQLGRDASEQELAAAMGISTAELEQLLADLRGLDLGSLQDTRGEDSEDTVLAHVRAEDEGNDPFTQTLQSEMRTMLECAIGELSAREKQILALYYYEELTMKEVGATLGLTESRICQIHSATLVKLRARIREMLCRQNLPLVEDSALETVVEGMFRGK